jgi:RNA polymerase sigma factor (sigma-70 family)
MATAQLGAVTRVLDAVRDDGADGALLERFRATRDDAAFTGLVRRHGGMVLGVCRRVLRDAHAAEDAFQAVFLVLARKADAVRPPGLLGAWLYGVAYRTALKARGREFRRRQVEQQYAQATHAMPAPRHDDEAADLRPVLDQQVNELPEKYRLPLVLCAVQGLGKAEAAERLGLPEGTVSSRLARAREMLRDRLARRGIAVPAALLGSVLVPGSLRAAVPTQLSAAAATVALGTAPAAPAVLSLTHEVLSAMTLIKSKFLAAVAVAAALTGGGFGLYTAAADEKKPGEKPAAVKPEAKPGEKPAKPVVDPDKPKPEKPVGEKPEAKPGEKPVKPAADTPDKPKPETPTDSNKPKPQKPVDPDKPKPDKPKPEGAPGIKLGGVVGTVDATARTVTLAVKGDKGPVDKVVALTADAKVVIDGKPGALSAVPKGSLAAFTATAPKDGGPVEASEIRVTGPTVNGLVTTVGESSVTIEYGSKEGKTTREIKLAPGGKVLISKTGDSKLTDLKVGDKLTVVLTTDQSGALTIGVGRDTGDKPKPIKPEKPDGDDDEG